QKEKARPGGIGRAFPSWIALSSDSGFLDDGIAVAANLFRLGEAIAGNVARPRVMAYQLRKRGSS
ncbi:hypothetical protein AB9F35_35465, partial [Rhizobium leguminosarum]|uniref:hypothetical protein n=1 Tax=Rhizobium leguminosarum TaxID=384 RepID=UPI003F9E0FFE